MIDLFILYDSVASRPQNTQQLINSLSVQRHFHIRCNLEADWNRWARIVNARGIGLVLGGGGARAYAHLGVVKALKQAGIAIDFIGGTSMGGIIAASYAMGWSDTQVEDRIRASFVETHPLSDYTLPLHGLVRGKKVEALFDANFSTRRISDLWLPFFCVSTNLTSARVHLHDSGEVRHALRASVSLPGILPPVIAKEGVLVDGGVMNNLPVAEMAESCQGPIIAVNVSRDLAVTPHDWQELIDQPLWQRMMKPPVINLLMRSGTVSGEQQVREQTETAHITLTPPLGQIEIRDWQAFDETVKLGYDYTIEQLESNHKLKQLKTAISPAPVE